MYVLADASTVEKAVEGVGSGRKSTGYRYAQVAEIDDHFTQRRVFSADLCDVVHTQSVQWQDIV